MQVLFLLFFLGAVFLGYVGFSLTRDEKDIFQFYFKFLLVMLALLCLVLVFLDFMYFSGVFFVFLMIASWYFFSKSFTKKETRI